MNFKNLIKKRSAKDYILYTALIVLGVLLDQITKLLAAKYLSPIDTQPLIEGVLHLTYVENTGAAFGMMKNSQWIFNTVSVITILAMSAYLYLGHAENRLYAVASAMIVSGGIGNMIDRIILRPSMIYDISRRYVVDFIDFTLIDFAVFNGADSFICVGAGLLILALLLDVIKEYRKEKTK